MENLVLSVQCQSLGVRFCFFEVTGNFATGFTGARISDEVLQATTLTQMWARQASRKHRKDMFPSLALKASHPELKSYA